MSTDCFSWLHLTDFHYGLKGQDCRWPSLRQPFLDSLAALHERCGPWHAVLFTGDLVQSGKSAQFEKMQAEVLDPLWQRLDELGSGDAALLAVPGNHDLYRPKPNAPDFDDPAVETLLDTGGFGRVEEKFWAQPGGSYRRAVKDIFAAYSQWWDEAPHRAADVKAGALPGDFSATLEHGGRRIGIMGLNTTFLQLAGGEYRGRLVWNPYQVQALCDDGVDRWTNDHDICLLLTHQGPDWLTPDARKLGDSEIAPAGRFAAHLFGHQHETDVTYLRRGGGRQALRRCQGPSVFGLEKFGDPPKTERAHGYMAGRIGFGEDGTFLRLWPRIATDGTGPWRFVPDHEHAELTGDEGTEPEPVAARSRPAAGTPAARTTTVDLEPAAAPLPASVAAPHSTLPSRRPFFGRDKDLEKIAGYLLPEDRSWGVVIDGPGGVGKTALALEAAYRAPAEHFPLKLWITAKTRELHPEGEQRLEDHRVGDYHALLNELGLALGRDDVPRAVPEDRPALVRHALAGHRALLVLDNLETISPGERQRVFELLGNLPGSCRAIVTSRRRAGSSFAAHALRLDKLEREAADELLAELGRRWSPVARLTAEERDRLYAETGGNPLLLTWTAGQLGRTTGRCRTVAEAVERLQEAHRRERQDANNNPLDFVFGDLIETFTPDETAVLAALVHFTRPAPLEWLLPLVELSPKAAETALDGLRDRALLVEDDRSATWLLPPLAARFLRRCRPEAVGASGQRLADQAYAIAVENGYQKHERFPVLEAAWPRVAAALPLLIAGDNRRLQTLCDSLRSFLDFSGLWDDWLLLSTEAEAAAERAKNFTNAGQRAYDVGYCHALHGQSAEVLACADRAVAHWQAASASAREFANASFLHGLGHQLAKDYPAATIAFREALDLWRGLSPKSKMVATGLNSLASVLRSSGRPDDAESHYREALGIAKAVRDPEGVATYTGNLGELALDREQWPEAEFLAREALKLAENVGRKELIASDCWRLAKALARQGRGGEGRYHAERAVAIFTELRSPDLAEAQAALDECLAADE